MRNLKEVLSYKVIASDGDVGNVVGFLLDDERWTVRYLIVETGGFVGGRRLLISPIAFRRRPNPQDRLYVGTTIDKVQKGPSIDLEQPITRGHERELNAYHRYSSYWGSDGVWGSSSHPSALATGPSSDDAANSLESSKVHLRRDADVLGVQVQGRDDEIGFITDVILDEDTWEVRYWVVDTGSWWPERQVLVAPQWATASSTEQSLRVDVSRESIKTSPAWTPTTPISREYETRLYNHYARRAYWDVEDEPTSASATQHRFN